MDKTFATQLYQLLLKKDATLLDASDDGAFNDYGSFGWVLGNDKEIQWECKGIARGYPMSSHRAEVYDCISLLSFLTHHLRYLDIHLPDDLCITSLVTIPVFWSKRKLFTLGILIRQVCKSSLTTTESCNLAHFGTTFHFALPHCTSVGIKMTRVISILSSDPQN
jgi:hypothetical protein